MPHVVFIHGIENKPAADQLLAIWHDSLAAEHGIDLAGAGCTSRMVYWADVLYESPMAEAVVEETLASEASSAASQAVVDISQAVEGSSVEAKFIAGLAGKYAAVALQAVATEAIAAPAGSRTEERVPLPWSIKEPLMAQFLRDVHHYLFNVEYSPRVGVTYRVRDEIRRRFVETLKDRAGTSGPYVVVSHSMGTVIAYDCLKGVADCPSVDALMTIGSPLGLDEVQDKLPGWSRETGFPSRQKVSGDWANVFDPLDPVCGFDPRLANDYEENGSAVIEDIIVRNSGWWRHSIDKYFLRPKLRNALRSMLRLSGIEFRDANGGPHTTTRRTADESADKSNPGAFESAARTESSDRVARIAARQLLAELSEAVQTFQHIQTAEICTRIVHDLCLDRAVFEADEAKKILSVLRGKRYFKQMIQVGDAFIQKGINAPQIRRQYAQGLIDSTQGLTDTGHMAAALCILEQIIKDEKGRDDTEVAEARGLIGRIHKQLYVNVAQESDGQIDELLQAIQEYYGVYCIDPRKYTWHGINVVALMVRAQRDNIPESEYATKVDNRSYQELAWEILANLGPNDDVWSLSTKAEAYLALGDQDRTMDLLKEYVSSTEADAFELSSTLRQLKEVWQLSHEDERQSMILALLQSQLMSREGSQMGLDASDLEMKPLLKLERERKLEKVFGEESYKTLTWYKTGLLRCSCIARFNTKMNRGLGTGFVVRGTDLHSKLADKFLVLTNAHVLSDDPHVRPALNSGNALVTFECWPECSEQYTVKEIIWSSPPGELDATLVELNGTPKECAGFGSWVPVDPQQKHVYVIGHPLGGGLSLSLHDNLFIEYRDPKVHYRTPSEPGSSGSPVFNDNWDFIGLHHAGDFEMKPLDGRPGTIEANEGIALLTIRDAIAAHIEGRPRPIKPSSHLPPRVAGSAEIPPHGALNTKNPARPAQPHSRPQPTAARRAPIVTYDTVVGMLSFNGAPREENTDASVVPADALRLAAEAVEEVTSDPRERVALLAEFSHAIGELQRESIAEGPRVLSSPRNKIASILQSVLAETARVTESAVLEFAFDKKDTKAVLSKVLKRAKSLPAHAQLHPANAAADKIADKAKVFIVSDFGTGLYGAPEIAATIARSNARFDLLLHLGDVYYSGEKIEVQNRFLDVWPKQAGEISRNLNGNHDMYSGGFGYFDLCLPAFNQKSSYFAMQNRRWLLVCLDTSYKDNNLGKKQVAWFEDVVQQAGDRKLILFSHHPLFSNFKEQGDKLAEKLHDVLHSRRISAWYWGHEHHCAIYKRHPIYRFLARCLGHGGMPYKRNKVAQYSVDENFAAAHNPGNVEWRKCAGPITPTTHYLDGPNKFVTEGPSKYGPHGYMTLEFNDSTVIESVCEPGGAVIYQRDLR
jgi:3',5'-cyclic AMP phosphodiesterase CpdA